MADATTTTALRKRYEHARKLDAAGQLRECMDYLENPEILVAEFADSFLTAEAFDNREEGFCTQGQTQVPMRRWRDRIVQRFIEAENVVVRGPEPHHFRYVAREIIPLWSSDAPSPSDPDERRRMGGGLDYLGVIEASEAIPVLGVVNPQEEPAPYLSLIRLLTCLAEVSPEAQMERANRFLFKGCLDPRPSFDLHVVLVDSVDSEPGDAPPPLAHLTKDLAHAFRARLKEEWQFPNLLRSISCLRMDSERFHGSLEVEWCV